MATFPTTRVLLLGLLLAAAQADAHSTYFTPDGKVRIVTGQLEEPVVTHAKTGLDVCFTTNTTARAPVTIDTGLLTASLVAPDNTTRLTQPLRAQFGRAGCYQFQEPYVLTVAGQYRIELNGTINGTAVDMKGLLAGSAVADAHALHFPMAGHATPETEALRAQVQDLQGRITALEQDERDAPAPAALALVAVLAVAALLARRSSSP